MPTIQGALWTLDQAILFEAARDAILNEMAYYSHTIATAPDKPQDAARLGAYALMRRRQCYETLRFLHVEDEQILFDILREHRTPSAEGKAGTPPGNAPPARLSIAERPRIFAEHIAPALLRGTRAAAHPVAILFAHLPGAGKVAFVTHAAHSFEKKGGAVPITAADLSGFHPLRWQSRQHPKAATTTLKRDIIPWMSRACATTIRKRRNMVVDINRHVSGKLIPMLAALRTAGYETELRLLVIHPQLSALGILQRYVTEKLAWGRGQLTSPTERGRTLSAILPIMERAQEEGLVDSITAYRQGGQVFHMVAHATESRLKRADLTAVIEQEMSRKLSDREARYIERSMHSIQALRKQASSCD